MPDEVRNLCRLADISSKSLLLQVVRQDTPEKMTALIEKIASQGGATRQQLREAAAKPKAGRPKHYVFAFRPPTKAFNLKLSFAKSRVNRDEIIDALEGILRELRKSRSSRWTPVVSRWSRIARRRRSTGPTVASRCSPARVAMATARVRAAVVDSRRHESLGARRWSRDRSRHADSLVRRRRDRVDRLRPVDGRAAGIGGCTSPAIRADVHSTRVVDVGLQSSAVIG